MVMAVKIKKLFNQKRLKWNENHSALILINFLQAQPCRSLTVLVISSFQIFCNPFRNTILKIVGQRKFYIFKMNWCNIRLSTLENFKSIRLICFKQRFCHNVQQCQMAPVSPYFDQNELQILYRSSLHLPNYPKDSHQ